MKEPRWIGRSLTEDIHAEQLALFGGPAGLRDVGLLESALTRPLNRWHYGCDSLAEFAAAYAFGLARNHPFIDGNKRTAFAVTMVFLRWNGAAFAPPPADATAAMLALAAGEINEDGVSAWITRHLGA